LASGADVDLDATQDEGSVPSFKTYRVGFVDTLA
jgi:hypothetical protein